MPSYVRAGIRKCTRIRALSSDAGGNQFDSIPSQSNLKRFSRMPTDWRLSLSVRCLSVRGFFFSLTVRVLDLPGYERVKSIGKPITDVNKPFFPIGGCAIS